MINWKLNGAGAYSDGNEVRRVYCYGWTGSVGGGGVVSSHPAYGAFPPSRTSFIPLFEILRAPPYFFFPSGFRLLSSLFSPPRLFLPPNNLISVVVRSFYSGLFSGSVPACSGNSRGPFSDWRAFCSAVSLINTQILFVPAGGNNRGTLTSRCTTSRVRAV